MPVRSTKISVHWMPIHGQTEPLRLIEGTLPRVVKIVDADVQHLSDAYVRSPDSQFQLRDYQLSDGKNTAQEWMVRDPEGKGTHDADWWYSEFTTMQKQAKERGLPFPVWEQMSFEGINEPPVWNYPTQTDRYNVAFCDRATQLQRLHKVAFYVAACGFGVGWPGNDGDDTPPNWEPYQETYKAIRRGNHYLHTHEYWQHRGVFYVRPGNKPDWGWYAGRYTQCKWKLPKGRWIISETGVDDGIIQRPKEGWDMGHISKEDYMWQLFSEYDVEILKDDRIGAADIFTMDARGEWWSFYTEKLYDLLIAKSQTYTLIEPQWKQPIVWPGEDPVWPPPPPPPPPDPDPDPDDPTLVITSLIQGLSRTLHIEECLAKAILEIEGGNRAYGVDGRLLIRFESHIMQLKMTHPAQYDLFFRHNPVQPWKNQQMNLANAHGENWTNIHTGSQETEWQAFELARSIEEKAAHLSIAMGIAQVMGFNHLTVGYASAYEMFVSFQASAINQIAGLFSYILETPGLLAAARMKDWDNIARLYNGSGQVDVYSPLLQAAYRRCKENVR